MLLRNDVIRCECGVHLRFDPVLEEKESGKHAICPRCSEVYTRDGNGIGKYEKLTHETLLASHTAVLLNLNSIRLMMPEIVPSEIIEEAAHEMAMNKPDLLEHTIRLPDVFMCKQTIRGGVLRCPMIRRDGCVECNDCGAMFNRDPRTRIVR